MKAPSRWLVLFLGLFGFSVLWVIAEAGIPLRWDLTGSLQMTLAIIAVAGLLSLRRSWRPLVSFGTGVVLAGFAWITQFLGDFSTPENTANSAATMTSTVLLAFAYVFVFRVLGNDQAKVERLAAERAQRELDFTEFEVLMRRVVADELDALRHPPTER